MGTGPEHDHDDMGGAARDLPLILGRRRMLAVVAGGGFASLLAACGDGGSSSASTTGATAADGTDPATSASTSTPGVTGPAATDAGGTTATTATTDGAACVEMPEETAGPFPGNGSNGPDVLGIDGVVRSDIRTSIGDASGTAEGVALRVRLTVVDLSSGCAPLAGAAVYLWHCDRDGGYSMYSAAVAGENYLRGVQPVGEEGTLEFITVFPGAYPGRWPHMHFEVYPSMFSAVEASGLMATSQLALPADACAAAYATSGYETSAGLLPSMSLDTDGIFRDGYRAQLASMSGTPGSDDFTASLTVAV